ncbi:ABCB family ABC transporter ATP-binding protein/permease [Methylophaga sp. OBS3]|uniref:ABCB family ABC transporter ATP-binding protein/permease n=1 Tax=Methylophaga sp. OBS3 TaxID=2991934 RepID=UPI0022506A62|nr:ABC transporter ATP-binding protein/permease [Methylophaga sp. OBS3]MCX4190779.1 ABC transporter ATP-binding protein/permease [Methylophaga sp. OBS3]
MRNHPDWRAIRSLLPFLWQFKSRVIIALLLLLLAKVANVGVPLALKGAVDALDPQQQALIYLPVMLLVTYGLLRLASSLFSELRDALFAKVIYHSIRRIAGQVFQHLHKLSLRFHLQRQTGGISRDIERGSRGISFLLNFMIFNILPTLVEIVLVTVILLVNYDAIYALITTGTIVLFIAYTLLITEWRMRFRRAMNDKDSEANNQAIDSLLNYETVKYFNNEAFEANRYDLKLADWERSAVKNQTSISVMNIGQGLIIAAGLTALMLLASQGVVAGELTIGDLVLVNAYLLQLYLPLGFLGFVYREIRHSLADMERMFSLMDQHQEIQDIDNAKSLENGDGYIRFKNVSFAYDANRPILQNISFDIPAGHKVAVVGASGSGKSTLVRLLFRFYDPQQGEISIDDQNIRSVDQHSLRQKIGVVPQDTVLFNESLLHNIRYGYPSATQAEVVKAARQTHIHNFISELPEGYNTLVGERGLKLSGGEKQRVAIARTLLKNPRILIFDEATSALDSHAEQAINQQLQRLSQFKTTLVIAHRLSTIIDADLILVMDKGRIIERGNHQALLALNGHYAAMWRLQEQGQPTADLLDS